MYGMPSIEHDAELPIQGLRKILIRYGGELNRSALESLKSELQELVPQGHYVGPDYGVRVLRIGYDAMRPYASKFFVEFEILCGGHKERLPIATFIELYRMSGLDLM